MNISKSTEESRVLNEISYQTDNGNLEEAENVLIKYAKEYSKREKIKCLLNNIHYLENEIRTIKQG